jgi:hypothetical protein
MARHTTTFRDSVPMDYSTMMQVDKRTSRHVGSNDTACFQVQERPAHFFSMKV